MYIVIPLEFSSDVLVLLVLPWRRVAVVKYEHL